MAERPVRSRLQKEGRPAVVDRSKPVQASPTFVPQQLDRELAQAWQSAAGAAFNRHRLIETEIPDNNRALIAEIRARLRAFELPQAQA